MKKEFGRGSELIRAIPIRSFWNDQAELGSEKVVESNKTTFNPLFSRIRCCIVHLRRGSSIAGVAMMVSLVKTLYPKPIILWNLFFSPSRLL
jgi:hypothetical protein